MTYKECLTNAINELLDVSTDTQHLHGHLRHAIIEQVWNDGGMSELVAENTRLRTACQEAIELAKEGWGYVDAYFREKWDYEERLAKIEKEIDP